MCQFGKKATAVTARAYLVPGAFKRFSWAQKSTFYWTEKFAVL
jgi:hypothetical protein